MGCWACIFVWSIVPANPAGFQISGAYADGFWIAAAVDASVVDYTIGYFAVFGFWHPSNESTINGHSIS